jgi:hypothetical protein
VGVEGQLADGISLVLSAFGAFLDDAPACEWELLTDFLKDFERADDLTPHYSRLFRFGERMVSARRLLKRPFRRSDCDTALKEGWKTPQLLRIVCESCFDDTSFIHLAELLTALMTPQWMIPFCAVTNHDKERFVDLCPGSGNALWGFPYEMLALFSEWDLLTKSVIVDVLSRVDLSTATSSFVRFLSLPIPFVNVKERGSQSISSLGRTLTFDVLMFPLLHLDLPVRTYFEVVDRGVREEAKRPLATSVDRAEAMLAATGVLEYLCDFVDDASIS